MGEGRTKKWATEKGDPWKGEEWGGEQEVYKTGTFRKENREFEGGEFGVD